MKSYYLYKITNLVNGKCYIGLTGIPKAREYQHLRKPKIESKLISSAVNKHGRDKFKFEVLVEGSLDYISDLESKAIELFSTIAPQGYNVKPGGTIGLAGYTISARKDDKPVYIHGFWFESLRRASATLNISQSTLRKRIIRGTAGDIAKTVIKSRSDDISIYVDGFWFPSTRHAKLYLCPNGENIKRKGFLGEILPKFGTPAYTLKRSNGMKGINAGESNGMYGKRVTVNAKRVCVQGVEYPSLTEAVRQTGFTRSQIEKRLKKGDKDFFYVQENLNDTKTSNLQP